MNKYELAVVLSAKLEDEESRSDGESNRLHHTFHGTVTDIDEWGKRPYEIQENERRILLLRTFRV